MPRKHRWTCAGHAAAAARRVPDGDCVGDCRVAGTTLDRPCPGRCVQPLLGVTARWRRGRRSRRGSRYTSTVVRLARQVAPGFDGVPAAVPTGSRQGWQILKDFQPRPVSRAPGRLSSGTAGLLLRPSHLRLHPRRPPRAGPAHGGARRCRRPAPARRPPPIRAGAVLVGPVIDAVMVRAVDPASTRPRPGRCRRSGIGAGGGIGHPRTWFAAPPPVAPDAVMNEFHPGGASICRRFPQKRSTELFSCTSGPWGTGCGNASPRGDQGSVDTVDTGCATSWQRFRDVAEIVVPVVSGSIFPVSRQRC